MESRARDGTWDGVACAILAGGLGTRLRDAVPDRPKPLAPVAGRPFVARLLGQLAAAGARSATLCTGDRGDQVAAALGESHAGLALRFVREPAPLGTGGALAHAAGALAGDTWLVLNGDSYCGLDFARFLAAHRAFRAGGGKATLAAARVEDAGRYGALALSPDGVRVRAFCEKNAAAGAGWINAGIYALDPSALAGRAVGRPLSLEREVFPELAAAGALAAFSAPGPFLDIGTPASYARAEAFFREL